MKPINPEKERIIRIINQLLQRSSLTIDQIVARMQVDGCDITRSTFENRFTTRVHQKPNVPLAWVRSLISAFTHNLSIDERCRAEEAVELARLVRLPIDLLPDLDRFFSKAEFTAAIEKHVPSLYARIEQRTTLNNNLLTKTPQVSHPKVAETQDNLRTGNFEDWGEAPDSSHLQGRQAELKTLQMWIEQEHCRAIGIFGMSGIGKTLLTTKVAHTLRHNFARICWRSLHNAPPLLDFLGDCLMALTSLHLANLPDGVEKRQRLLLQTLRDHRCLLIIDNFETVMADENSRGRYRPGYEDYSTLVRKMAETTHKSCVLLTSQEKPIEFAIMESDSLAIRTLTVGGLSPTDAQQLLANKRLQGTEAEWTHLCIHYSGNPLALKLAADAIHELFTGDIQPFLATEATLFHDIRELLDQQFSRLTLLERDLLYWLGIERERVTLATLHNNLLHQRSQVEIVEALHSLRRRSLIEQHQSGFSLATVVLGYITERLVKLISAEIEAEMPLLLGSFALLKTQTKEYLRDTQLRLILHAVLDRLRYTHRPEEIAVKLWRLVRSLQAAAQPAESQPVENYCAGNLLNLLVNLPADLAKRDLSQLYIHQAHLHNVSLQDVNFSHAIFHNSTFLETFGSISTVAYSPNGDRLAAGMTSGEIQIWSLQRDTLPLKLQGHTDMIWSVAFHPDGTRLVSSSEDQTVRVWDVVSGEALLNLHAHNGWVKSACFSHAGDQLASVGHDALVRLWDANTGQSQLGWIAHDGWIWAIAYSPDDRLLATAGQDHLIKLWDRATGECVHTLQGHSAPVRALAFAPTGDRLVSGSFDHTIKVWQVSSGLCERTLFGHTNLIWSVAFSPDGTCVASSADDQSVRLWDIATGEARNLFQEQHNRVWSIAFHPNGQMLTGGGDDQTLRFWDVTSGQLVRKQEGYTNQVWSVALAPATTPHGRQMASSGDDGIVRLWQVENSSEEQRVRLLQGHTERVRAVAFSPNGSQLASGGDDHAVRLWHLQRGVCSHLLTGHTNRVWSVAFNPDGRALASASEDQTVRLWDVESGRTRRTIRHTPGRIWAVAWHPLTPLLAGGTDATEIYLWEAESGELLQRWQGHQSRVWSVVFSPDGQWLASGSADRTVRLWEVASGRCVYVLEGHADAVWSVAFSPDSQWLASSGDDQRICLWHVTHGALVHTLQGHQGCVWTLAFGEEGLLASGSQDETIRLWDARTGVWRQTLRSERPYERMNITGVEGLTETQKLSLRALGAIERE